MWPTKKRWVALGGMVKSRKTGERVYAEARLLARAYGIDPKGCILVDTRGFDEKKLRNTEWRLGVAYAGIPVLRPLDDGRYAEERKRLVEEYGYKEKGR